MKSLGVVDIKHRGKVRRLPDVAIKLFARDHSGNLVELSSDIKDYIDPKIFKDEFY
tara:strand:+ start:756 stop:923 length:168 start_codon:yes stop_codon:yes gene_type:complete